MATNNKISVSELDFDRIKENLKEYLRGQSELSDYDFEGSGLSLLLDILSYNTHYNALYTNLAINEAFLDSAVKRDSIVSRAFALGYTPRSAKSSTAILEIKVSNADGNPDYLTLSKNLPFTTVLNGKQYSFYTTSAHTVNQIAGTYTFTGVEVKEGLLMTQSYAANDGVRYEISNTNCDTSTITVSVRDSISSTNSTVYNYVDDILSVKSTDPVFFIREIEDKKYEIQFGNGSIGKALQNGNIVTISYMITNRSAANGARIFKYSGSFEGITASSIIVRATTISYGGEEIETTDTIKYLAPRMYSAVNRAVTVEDYKTIIQRYYPNIDSINVWSGTDNIPPVYGKVFISIKPNNETILSPGAKNLIRNEILKTRNVTTITPEFVDPFYLNVSLNVSVYYDPQSTVRTAEEIKTLVLASITRYNNTDLKRFDSVFRYSKLMNVIDSTDSSIKSNITTVTIRRPVVVKYNTAAKYTFHIDNPIYSAGVPEDAVTSTGFYVSGSSEVQYLQDDGYGVIKRYYLDANNTKIYTNNNQGTVVYATGEITLTDLTIVRLASSELQLIIKPQSNDIVSVREHIVQIDFTNFTINTIVDTIAAGNSFGGTNYIFSNSR